MNSKKTIDDIASELGLSKSTVSRAISGKGRISPETTERVRAYIRKHNYKPNAVAQGLAQQKTYSIGVVCPIDYEIFDLQYFHRCLHGISDSLTPMGYDIVLSMIGKHDIGNLRRLVENRKVDGIILTRTLFDDEAAEYLKKGSIPFVVIGSSPDQELVQVDNDHLTACSDLTGTLLSRGFRRIALMGGDGTHIITDTRRKGYELAFAKAGVPLDESIIYMNVEEPVRAGAVLKDVLQKDVDCLICMDEKLTGMVMSECRSRHIRIPEDLRLASFYNSAFLANSTPAVTALDIDDQRLGAAAGAKLLEMIAGEKPESVLIRNYQVILRESTSERMNTDA